MIEDGIKITFCKKKCACNDKYINTICKFSKNLQVKLEYGFYYKNSYKSADVAYIDENGNIMYIFEICHTHHTKEDSRPEDIPWFEIKATELLDIVKKKK